MSTFIALPTALPGGSIVPGQLVTDPFNGEAIISCLPSSTHHQPDIRSKSQTGINHDATVKHPPKQFERKDSVILNVEETTETTLARPRTFFNAIQQDKDIRAFLQNSALQYQNLYFVNGIQTLRNPSTKYAVVHEGPVAEASKQELRLPMHVRRPDSASKSNNDDSNSTRGTEEKIHAVELMKVKCRVGDKSAPHEAADLDYDWSYYSLEGDLQLSIGLGSLVEPVGLAEPSGDEGMSLESGFTDENWDYALSEDDDDSGLGGF
jgi:hypothetical protein